MSGPSTLLESPSSSSPSSWRRPLLAATATAMLVGCSLLAVSAKDRTARNSGTLNDLMHHEEFQPPTLRNLQDTCETQCANPKFHDLELFQNVDLVDPKNMLNRLKAHRNNWVIKKLFKNYGKEMYEAIFHPLTDIYDAVRNTTRSGHVSIGIGADGYPNPMFEDPAKVPPRNQPKNTTKHSVAWDRLVRKWQIKILQLQVNMLDERKLTKPKCLDECNKRDEAGGRRNLVGEENGVYGKFVWATGGHSASAGHGNMFDESYTAVMGDALNSILPTAMGLEFEAKNYAMGGTDCAEEIALCYESVFGQDVDFFSWDYGMTDGHLEWKFIMYAYHAAQLSKNVNPAKMTQPGNVNHRPAFFAIHSGGARDMVMTQFQEMGMTTLTHDVELFNKIIKDVIPDTFGKNEAQIKDMPPFLQYLKCDGKTESGEPGCQANKFNLTMCPVRKFCTSWHPGWKYMALVGNFMATTQLDAAEYALQGLVEMEAAVEVKEADDLDGLEAKRKRLFDKMMELSNAEQKDYDNIFSSPIPEEFSPFLDRFWTPEQKEHLAGVDPESFLLNPSFCHTALLPSEIRFGGFLTENFTATGRILDQNYEQGFVLSDVRAPERPNPRSQPDVEPVEFKDSRPGMEDKLLLIQAPEDRQVCDVNLNLDFKDYYMISNREGTRSITIPNDSELKEFKSFDAAKSKGYVLACNPAVSTN